MGPNLPGFSRSCLILSLPGGFGLTGRFSLFPVMNLSWRSFALGRAGLAGVGCTWPSLTWATAVWPGDRGRIPRQAAHQTRRVALVSILVALRGTRLEPVYPSL